MAEDPLKKRPAGFGPGYQGPPRKPGEPAPLRSLAPRPPSKPIARVRPFVAVTKDQTPSRPTLDELLATYDEHESTGKRFGVSLSTRPIGALEKHAHELARMPSGLIITCGPAFEPAARLILRAADDLERKHGMLNHHGFAAAKSGDFVPVGITVLRHECNANDLAVVGPYLRRGLFLVGAPRYRTAASVLESIRRDAEAWSANDRFTEAALLNTTLEALRYIVTTRTTMTGWSGQVYAADRSDA